MAKKNYYAVAKGRTPGIYFSWPDCKAAVEGYSGAVYKGFQKIEEAEAFIKMMKEDADVCREKAEDGKGINSNGADCLTAYVDGSYDEAQNRYAYGCVFVLEDGIITINDSDAGEDYVSMRNVAGEILGSEKAIEWAIEKGYKKIIIYYDYEGIEKWANGIWKANKPGTIRYKEYVEMKRRLIEIDFCKVTAHSGDDYNDMADKLAKEALGIH